MAPYARYVPSKPDAPVAAATIPLEHVPVPSKSKQVKVPKGPSRSDDSGRKKRKRAELDNPPTVANDDDDKHSDTPAIPSKHSAVYSKFQKAAQRSEAAKATAPDEHVDSFNQPELHGMRQPFLALVCTHKPDCLA